MSVLGPLNLSDADTGGFEAVDAGRYNAEVADVSMDSVKNEGKMPIGTPMIKIRFRLTDEEVEGKSVFTQFIIPPPDYDKKKADIMNGMFVRFLTAIGEDEKKVRSGKYDPDFEDFKGRACVVTVSKEQWPPDSDPPEYQNRVKGIKAAGSDTGSGKLL